MRISDWSSDVCSSDLDRIMLAVQPFRGDPQCAEGERGAENHPLRGLESVCGFIEGTVVGVQLYTADLIEQVLAANVVVHIRHVQVAATGDVVSGVVTAESHQFISAGVAR